jgi:hypothetical protein
MSESPPPDEETKTRRATRGYRQQHIILASSGLAIYLSVLWFGVTVIGDTVSRSSLMAGLIVILAGMAYITSYRPPPPEQ